MKKMIALAMAMTMGLSLVACGSSDTAASTDTAAETTEAADTADTAEETEVPSAGGSYTIGICQLVQHEALDAATQGFKDAIVEALGEDAVTFDEQNAQGDSNTCATIINGFVAEDADLILANATPALQAAQAGTSEIPILGTSVTEYGVALGIDSFDGTVGGNISGTSDLAPLTEQAAMLNELFPDAKNIGILYCSSEPNSIYQSKTITKYLEDKGYKVKDYTFSDSNDVASVTKNACDASDVIYIPTDNTAASCTEAINNVTAPAKIPVFTGEEGIAKGCGVATLSISYYDLGYETGEMAYDILVNGEDVSKMEVKSAPKFTKEYIEDRAKDLNVTIPDDYEKISAE